MNIEKVFAIKYQKVEKMVPARGITRIFHVDEEKYYNWDAEKKVWIQESRKG